MSKTIEEVLLNRVKVIGDGEWTLLGTPDDVIKELEAVKIAHGEMVIGEDETLSSAGWTDATPKVQLELVRHLNVRNVLRAEQRERNKV